MNDRINLIIKHQPSTEGSDVVTDFDWVAGADALLLNPLDCGPEDAPAGMLSQFILQSDSPERDQCWQEVGACQWVCSEGLEQAARMRDDWPGLDWMPFLKVYRQELSYRFSGRAVGEGFSFYIPDTSVIKGWKVTDEDRNLPDALSLARELGFSQVWLHSLNAEEKGQGLDLEMLENATHKTPEIWVSGGLTEVRHLSNLAKWGGASSVIVDQTFAESNGIEPMRLALIPETVNQVAPELNFG